MSAREAAEVLKSELGDTEGDEIFTRVLAAENINLDAATDDQKRAFIQHLLAECPSFGMTKLKDLHNKMLRSLGILLTAKTGGMDKKAVQQVGPSIDFEDPRFKDINQLLTDKFTIEEFWHYIEKFYLKVESSFRIYWQKSRELSDSGADKQQLLDISSQDFDAMSRELEEESAKLIAHLNIADNKKSEKPQLAFFDISVHSGIGDEKESEQKIFMRQTITHFLEVVGLNFKKVSTLFYEFLDKDLSFQADSQEEYQLLQVTKRKMAELWRELSIEYLKLRDTLHLDALLDKKEEKEKE